MNKHFDIDIYFSLIYPSILLFIQDIFTEDRQKFFWIQDVKMNKQFFCSGKLWMQFPIVSSFLIYRMWRSKISNQKAVIGVESRDNWRAARNVHPFRLWGLVNILFPRIQTISPFSTLLSLIWNRTHSSTFWFWNSYSLCFSFTDNSLLLYVIVVMANIYMNHWHV